MDIEQLHSKLCYSSQFNRYWTFAILGNLVGANKDTTLTTKIHILAMIFYSVTEIMKRWIVLFNHFQKFF